MHGINTTDHLVRLIVLKVMMMEDLYKEVGLHMVEFLCVHSNLAGTRALVIVLMR